MPPPSCFQAPPRTGAFPGGRAGLPGPGGCSRPSRRVSVTSLLPAPGRRPWESTCAGWRGLTCSSGRWFRPRGGGRSWRHGGLLPTLLEEGMRSEWLAPCSCRFTATSVSTYCAPRAVLGTGDVWVREAGRAPSLGVRGTSRPETARVVTGVPGGRRWARGGSCRAAGRRRELGAWGGRRRFRSARVKAWRGCGRVWDQPAQSSRGRWGQGEQGAGQDELEATAGLRARGGGGLWGGGGWQEAGASGTCCRLDWNVTGASGACQASDPGPWDAGLGAGGGGGRPAGPLL